MRLLAADLCIDRSGQRVLSGVSFGLERGQALLVTGDNGAGKSSLLRVLAGFLAPGAGTVRFESTAAEEASLHYLGHRDGLKAQLTSRENLSFAAEFLAGETLGDPLLALTALGLEAAVDVPVAWLSTGQRRRVALARLLVAPRPLWLLDEPTSGLDARAVVLFEEACARHLGDGGMIVAATHQPLRFPARELRLGATSQAQ